MTRNGKTYTHTRAHALTYTHIYAHTHKRAAGNNELAETDTSAAVYPALFRCVLASL